MKMTRKLIPALAMLLVSAIMLSTASFAWFASNNVATVDGMNVTVKTEASFLEIAAGNATSATTYFSKATAANTGLIDDGEGNKTTVELDLVRAVLSGDGKKVIVWQTGTSDDPTKPTSNTTYTEVTDAVTGQTSTYTLYNEFAVRMSAGSTDNISELVMTGVTATVTDLSTGSAGTNNLLKALRVLVVGTDGVQLYTNATGTWTLDATNSNAYLIDEVTKDAETLQVYVYFDGDDATAYTNNVANLDNINVTVTFGPKA